MVKLEENSGKSVYGLEKSLNGNRAMLTWKSTGLSEFIVLYSEKKEGLLFDGKDADLLVKALEDISDRLVSEKKMRMKNDVLCYYFTLSELKRDGGMPINNRPGHFAVYGVSVTNGTFTVYTLGKDAANVFFMTVDVEIAQKLVMVGKGLFKKKEEYSGYRCITLAAANPSLTGGVLKYIIGGCRYPFPDEVVKNGGSFYVKLDDENQTILFESGVPGVIIK